LAATPVRESAFGAAWNRHDVAAIMTFMADDCAFETTAGSEVCGQRYEGCEAVRKAFARVFSIFPDAHFGDPRHFVAGDRGRTEWTFTGVPARRPAGRGLSCDLLTFGDGKIALESSYHKNRLRRSRWGASNGPRSPALVAARETWPLIDSPTRP
jgi:ketosteroid isomerase-like protein